VAGIYVLFEVKVGGNVAGVTCMAKHLACSNGIALVHGCILKVIIVGKSIGAVGGPYNQPKAA
jgi:hypothetical protein